MDDQPLVGQAGVEEQDPAAADQPLEHAPDPGRPHQMEFSFFSSQLYVKKNLNCLFKTSVYSCFVQNCIIGI